MSENSAFLRFPKPEFSSGYVVPELDLPTVLFNWEAVRLGFLVLFLVMTAYALFRMRSRKILLLIAVGNLLVFGFFFTCCICPLGLLQSVPLAIFDPQYYLAAASVLILVLPLFAALYFGRIFCMGGCPFGALQELLHFKSLQPPKKLDEILRLGPYFVLAVIAAAAASGFGFLLCRFDPFVPFFRFGGVFWIMMAGVLLLAVGTIIGRVFCRYVCPYGALLRIFSLFSRKRVNPADGQCINCRLCEKVCPVNAIVPPVPALQQETIAAGLGKFQMLLCALPFVMIGAALTGAAFGVWLFQWHPDVVLLKMLEHSEENVYTLAFASSGGDLAKLDGEVSAKLLFVRAAFAVTFSITALLAGIEILVRIRKKPEAEHIVSVSDCVCCGRCYNACPVKKEISDEKHKNT